MTSITTQRAAHYPPEAEPIRPFRPQRPLQRPRRRSTGAGFGGFGPLPVVNLVTVEIGFAIGLLLLVIDSRLLWVGLVVLAVALVLALVRWRGRWLVQWIGLTARYVLRSHDRVVSRPNPSSTAATSESESTVTGSADPRVALLRLLVPDLVIAEGIDHEHHTLGMAWHDGGWTAVLLVEPDQALVSPSSSANLPLGALAPCLEDRGVVLDTIRVIWHCYPGSTALPYLSPALDSYLEVLGPLPAAARRTTWVAVRLDPRRCPAAVAERGGGVIGAHRALIGALARVRNALATQGISTRPLDTHQLLRAGISAAELTGVAGTQQPVPLRERWSGVTAAGVGHAGYAITNWPMRAGAHSLNALTGVRALSSTLALSIAPSGETDQVALRGVFRVSARHPGQLRAADTRLKTISGRLGVGLTPLRGMQAAALAETVPLGGAT